MFKHAIGISLVLAGLFSANFVCASVVINEVAWMGTEVSHNDEWIELYNGSSEPVNLDGWVLKASDGTPEIPLAGTLLTSKGFYLLERTNDDSVPGIAADQIYTGALKNSGETLQLYDVESSLIDTVDCSSGWFAGDNMAKQTMERAETQWQTSQNSGGTPKAQNSIAMIIEPAPQQLEESPSQPESEPEPEPQSEPEPEAKSQTTKETQSSEETQSPTATSTEMTKENPEPSAKIEFQQEYARGIIINEILPSPEGPDAEEEWIELFNENDFEVDISLWQLTDTVGQTKTYTFPQGTKLSAQAFLVLTRPETGITLNNNGEELKILHPDANIVETVAIPNAPRGQSYSRIQQNWVWSSALTPSQPNIVPLPTPETKNSNPVTVKPAQSTTEQYKDPSSANQHLAKIAKPLQSNRNAPTRPLSAILIAACLAIFSAVIILILKKKLKTETIDT